MRNLKHLLALALVALASLATGATLTPIQLLNPAGSTAGQAILSTGASTAPVWGTPPLAANSVTLANIAQIGANTILANPTGSTANVSALAMPSCSAAGNNLQYTSGTGFTCATGYALLASPTFTGTVTTAALTATGAITPSQTNGIVGTTTNNNANAGAVGEYVVATAGPTGISTGTSTNIVSMNLTAGDWDVTGVMAIIPAGGTTLASYLVGISTTSSTLGGFGSTVGEASAFTVGAQQTVQAANVRLSLPSTTTVYFIAFANFSGSTLQAQGIMRARRIR